MINFRNVRKEYPPDQTALRNVDLRVEEGEFVFLVGASGAGKSTLLKLIFAEDRPSSGQVLVGGRNLATVNTDSIAILRREIGVIFQDYKLLTRRTILENVAFPLEVQAVRARERSRLALNMLETIGLADRANSLPQTLSGGEQQRVAVARALINRPRLVLADEPTGNLDHEMSKVVLALMLDAHKAGTTILCATHNLALIESLNLRTIVLDKGKIVGDFENPRGLRA